MNLASTNSVTLNYNHLQMNFAVSLKFIEFIKPEIGCTATTKYFM